MIIQAYELGTTRAASLLSCSFTNETPGTTSSWIYVQRNFTQRQRTVSREKHELSIMCSVLWAQRASLGAIWVLSHRKSFNRFSPPEPSMPLAWSCITHALLGGQLATLKISWFPVNDLNCSDNITEYVTDPIAFL